MVVATLGTRRSEPAALYPWGLVHDSSPVNALTRNTVRPASRAVC